MIVDLACIVGAGWKGGRTQAGLDSEKEKRTALVIPPRCPELLYPLNGKGQTVLSRLAKQFRSLGAQHVLAGVANPDCCPTEQYEDHVKERSGVERPGRGQPPWTHERVDEVRRWARPVLVDNPFKASGWSTYKALFEVASRMPDSKWQRLVATSGDYVLQTDFLTEVVQQAVCPSICWLKPIHEMLFLDRAGLDVFLRYLSEHRRAPVRRGSGVHGLRGKDVWYDRCMLEDELGIRSWTPGQWYQYTNKTHRHDELVGFEEIGAKPNEWHRACLIEREDPI